MTERIPRIDLSGVNKVQALSDWSVHDVINHACRDLGFLIITGHGVAAQTIDAMYEECAAFFSLPQALKDELALGKHAEHNGYVSNGREQLDGTFSGLDSSTASHPLFDYKESFGMGPLPVPGTTDPYYTSGAGQRYFQPTPFPTQCPQMRSIFTAYWLEMERLASRLMRMFALALKLPEHIFDQQIDRHISHLFAHTYPPFEARQQQAFQGTITRAAPHTDFGSLTILHAGRHPEGLEVLDPHAGPSAWVPLQPKADEFVINLGDLMARWTNDQWKSTVHRVTASDVAADKERFSLTFFHQPNHDAIINPLPGCAAIAGTRPYPPITSGAHYEEKINALRTATED